MINTIQKTDYPVKGVEAEAVYELLTDKFVHHPIAKKSEKTPSYTILNTVDAQLISVNLYPNPAKEILYVYFDWKSPNRT